MCYPADEQPRRWPWLVLLAALWIVTILAAAWGGVKVYG